MTVSQPGHTTNVIPLDVSSPTLLVTEVATSTPTHLRHPFSRARFALRVAGGPPPRAAVSRRLQPWTPVLGASSRAVTTGTPARALPLPPPRVNTSRRRRRRSVVAILYYYSSTRVALDLVAIARERRQIPTASLHNRDEPHTPWLARDEPHTVRWTPCHDMHNTLLKKT